MDNNVHLKSLGLRCHPFPVAPDDKHFYITRYFEQLIGEIVHGIASRKGFMVVSGDVGVGKTTITRRILKILTRQEVRTSLVFHTSLKDVDLLREINRDFGLEIHPKEDEHQLGDHLQRLYEFLLSQYHAGKNCAIIIDDAQNLDRDSLELVRMISNLEADQQKLVQILLVGQTELVTRLGSHAMRQLYSRIVIRKVVRSLSHDEMRNYIRFKLSCAGDNGRITVTRPAFFRLYRRTKGNLRQLNLMLDRCLYALCRNRMVKIDHAIVGIADADLNPEKHRFRRRLMALAASLILPLILAVGSWGIHLQFIRTSTAAVTPSPKRYKVPHPPVPDTATTSEAGAAVGKRSSHGAKASLRDPAVEAFLRINQLEHYSDAFQLALEKGRLDHLAQQIYGETGMRLVQLKTVPNSIRQRYGALAFTVARNQQPMWLLFWRPQLELKRFQRNYKGTEIKKLQQRLSDLKLYRYKIDGIVGRHLIRAVSAFQARADLKVTGFPDETTLFWLCHQSVKEGKWPKA